MIAACHGWEPKVESSPPTILLDLVYIWPHSELVNEKRELDMNEYRYLLVLFKKV